MRQLILETGGRPVANDDFELLQSELTAATEAVLQGAPPLVLSGCRLQLTAAARGNIGPGYVWIGGHIERYDGAADVALPAEIALDGVLLSDERAYQTGGSKACQREQLLRTVPAGTVAAGAAIGYVGAGPLLTYFKWVESQLRTVSEVQWLTNHEAGAYSQEGRGLPGTAAAGWALCNGVGGTADLQERFIVGMNPAKAAFALGKTGGAAQVVISTEQLPAHTHTMQEAGEHTHSVASRAGDGNNSITRRGNDTVNDGNVKTGSAGKHTHTLDTTGGGKPLDIVPPFYVLVARQWVGL